MFRRTKSPAEPATEQAAVTTAEPDEASRPAGAARSRSYTPSKKDLGQVTPKRKGGGRIVEPPPANRREALRRSRQKQREARAEARAGMMAGKEEYLLPRDKGPERAAVRDVVDARRNLATYFLPGALIVLLGSAQAMPPVVRLTANLLWFLIAAGVVVDSFMLSRKVRRVLTERFPKSTTRPRSHYWYAIMRSLSFRKMRMPAPRVKVGQQA